VDDTAIFQLDILTNGPEGGGREKSKSLEVQQIIIQVEWDV